MNEVMFGGVRRGWWQRRVLACYTDVVFKEASLSHASGSREAATCPNTRTDERTRVKARQYKRTFTGSLHFYGLNSTATLLRVRARARRPSTECRKPSTRREREEPRDSFCVQETPGSLQQQPLFFSSLLLFPHRCPHPFPLVLVVF